MRSRCDEAGLFVLDLPGRVWIRWRIHRSETAALTVTYNRSTIVMKLKIIYDNESYLEGLRPDWGFSCLIEARDKRILFDTGTDGMLLLENMHALGIAPASITEVFFSHAHFDHIGGLATFLRENEHVKIYAPETLRGIRPAAEVVYVKEPIQLDSHFHSTVLLENIEQSLVIEDEKGVIVIVGCSHPGVGAILESARNVGRPHTLVGGLHGFDEYPLLGLLDFVCPTHCTQHISEIRSRYPEKYVPGGAGAVIEI